MHGFSRPASRSARLALFAGLALASSAHAQFSWQLQTSTPEWSSSQQVNIGPDSFCINNWNGGMTLLPLCPPFPSPSTNANIPQGSSLYINSAAFCNQLSTSVNSLLELRGGSLRCASTQFESTFLWTGGTLTNSPDFTIGPAGLIFQGPNTKAISASTIHNTGSVDWNAGPITVVSGTVIDNSGGWNAFSDDAINFAGGAGVLFDNHGAFTKSGGSDVTSVGLPFHNANLVSAFVGTIRFASTLTSDAGHFRTLTGTSIEFPSINTFNLGTLFDGPGLFRFSGNSTVDGLVIAQRSEISGGNFGVNPGGEFRVNDSLDWLGGTLGAGGGVFRVIASASANLTGPNDKAISALTLQNDGHVNWTNGNIVTVSGAVFDNRNTFSILGGNQISFAGGAPTLLRNTGLIEKLAGPTSTIQLPFAQDGQLRATGGDLALSGQTISTGAWQAGAGRTFVLQGTTQLEVGTTLRGNGLYRNFGTLTVNGPIPVDFFHLADGQINGPGRLQIDRGMTWDSGSLSNGGGVLDVGPNATLTIQSPPAKNISDHQIRNLGSVTWSGGNLVTVSGTLIDNQSIWDSRSDAELVYAGGAGTLFSNAGIFSKSAGIDATSINMPFTNTGVVMAHVGTIRFGSPTTNTSLFIAEDGAAMQYQSTIQLNAGARLDGAGLHRISGGSFNVNAAVPIESLAFQEGQILLNPGGVATVHRAFTWTGGSLTGDTTGLLELDPGSVATLSGAGKTIAAVTFRPRGSLTWNSGDVAVVSSARIENQGAWTCAGDNSLSYVGGAPTSMLNAGTLTKSGSPGITAFNLPFTNTGSISAAVGTIRFGSSFVQTAGITTLQGGTIASFSSLDFAGGFLTGDGPVAANVLCTGADIDPGQSPAQPGMLAIAGAFTLVNGALVIDVDSGDPAGADRLVVSGPATLGGTLRVRHNVGVAPGSTWTILSAASRNGVFAALDLPHGFSIQYTPTAVILSASCNSDCNDDGNIDQGDVDYFVNAVSGGGNPTAFDLDFNSDGNVDQGDVDALINVIAGGNCP